MRIDELTFPKDIEQAAIILQKHGYKRIGNVSSFGLVFHKAGENSVLKLYENEDHAYTIFVDFCRYQTNIHFPRFSRSSLPVKGTGYSAVKTEILQEGDPDILKRVARYFKWIVNQNLPTDVNDPYFSWLKANPSLAEAFRLLKAEFLNQPGIHFDLHEENMMMRGNTIVIIDPITP